MDNADRAEWVPVRPALVIVEYTSDQLASLANVQFGLADVIVINWTTIEADLDFARSVLDAVTREADPDSPETKRIVARLQTRIEATKSFELTVGDIRRAISTLDDGAPVHPCWFAVPGKSDPCVTIHNVSAVGGLHQRPYLGVFVSLTPLESEKEEK